MSKTGNIYFASDLHLGSPSRAATRERERHFCRWLDMIKADAAELYLLGDIFDFWFEYRKAVPKGFVRIQGKLAELADMGIAIHYFSGNHDLWLKQYFTEIFNAKIYHKPVEREIFGKTYILGHGDGLGPGDHGYKMLKKLFRNPVAKWMFHRLHPNFGIGLAEFLSRRSRRKTGHKDAIDYGEKEFLIIYSREQLKERPEIDYLVFGHRHLPRQIELEKGKFYINLGDWISHFTYLVAGPDDVQLMRFPVDGPPVPFSTESTDQR